MHKCSYNTLIETQSVFVLSIWWQFGKPLEIDDGWRIGGVSQWGTPCSASAVPDRSSFYLLISLRCTSRRDTGSSLQTLAVEYYKACTGQKSDSHQIKSLSLLSDALMCSCVCVFACGSWRLGQTDRSVWLRHLNSCELHPAIPLLQWLLGPRRFSIFPDRRSLGIWLSNQRGPAALLIYDLASQHSAGPIHHLHPGLFVVFNLRGGPLAVICCLSFNYSAWEELEEPAQLKFWDWWARPPYPAMLIE